MLIPHISIPSPSVSYFQVGPFIIHFYALFILLGIALAVAIGNRRWQAQGGQKSVILDIALWAVPIGILGARIFHVLTHFNYYFHAGANPLDVFKIWEGGLAIYGGLIFGVLGAWLGARNAGMRFLAVADALAPGILVAQAIGRLGNYFNQELFGLPTALPWGLQIDSKNAAYPAGFPDGVLFHPTFLYELVWNLLGFAIIVFVLQRFMNLKNGRMLAIYLVYYSIGRAFIESIRIDPSDYYLGLRTNVWSALITILVGVGLFIWSKATFPGDEVSLYLPGREPKPEDAEAATDDTENQGSKGQDGLDFDNTATDDNPVRG